MMLVGWFIRPVVWTGFVVCLTSNFFDVVLFRLVCRFFLRIGSSRTDTWRRPQRRVSKRGSTIDECRCAEEFVVFVVFCQPLSASLCCGAGVKEGVVKLK